MQFLCVCYYDVEAFSRFGPDDFKKLGEFCAPHDAAFKATGKVRFVGSLGLPHEFRTMRAEKGGAVRVEDGPYAQTSHPFGAFFMIEADSIDQAVEIARLHPGTHLGDMMAGGIEVRPVGHYEEP